MDKRQDAGRSVPVADDCSHQLPIEFREERPDGGDGPVYQLDQVFGTVVVGPVAGASASRCTVRRSLIFLRSRSPGGESASWLVG